MDSDFGSSLGKPNLVFSGSELLSPRSIQTNCWINVLGALAGRNDLQNQICVGPCATFTVALGTDSLDRNFFLASTYMA
jgi:hypothetical protein